MSDSDLHLENQLCFALYRASRMIQQVYRPMLEELGLTYPQYLVMLVLWEQDGLSVGALGERLFLDSGTLTPLLKRMEAAGWLVRARAKDDERRVVVSLTPEGRALRARAIAVPRAIGCATRCSMEELADLRQRLHALRRRLSPQLVESAARDEARAA